MPTFTLTSNTMTKFILLSILLVAIWTVTVNGITIPKDDTKVVGGQNAIQGVLPFMVSVHNNTNFVCSGVLIDVNWVLTSAFCLWKVKDQKLRVFVGGVTFTGTEVGRYEIDVNEGDVIVHEDYVDSNSRPALLTESSPRESYVLKNNLALLKLEKPAIPSAIIQPITLTDFTEITQPKTIARVAGWGGKANGSQNPILQYSSNLETMRTVDCSLALQIELNDLDVCTEITSQATCEFDHGGALYKMDATRGSILIGIVNYAPCGIAYPNVYASTTGQRWWINKVTGL